MYCWPVPRELQILSAWSPRVGGPARGPGVAARVVAVAVHVRRPGHVSARAPVLAGDARALVGQPAPPRHHLRRAAQLEVGGRLK